MLRVIVFTCGAALMGLELVAARLLAPAMGNSIYVWGSVISSVMAALSLGYWLGGHGADRWGAARLLPIAVGGAAATTVVVPLVASGVVPWAAEFGPRLGSLVASIVIFFGPALLLAMVSPIGVRLATTRGIEHVGRSAGSLYAVSTAGSIVGTLVTAFWLIPLLSLEPLIVWIGFVLAATSLLALWRAQTTTSGEESSASMRISGRMTLVTVLGLAAATLVVGGLVLAGAASASPKNALGEAVLFSEDTQYHRITVTEDDEVRHLRFDRSHQSAMYLDDPFRSAIRYPDYFHLALGVKPDAERVLVLGLGGGTVVKQFWRDHPEMHVDSVEIDPVVADVAERYFALPDDERIELFVEDARRYVQRTDEMYDIVIIDAYYADGLPFHLTTTEFFEEVDAILEPGGVVAYNVISSVEGDGSDLFRSLYRTALGVWDHLWVFPVGLSDGVSLTANRNIIVVATDVDIPRDELLDRIRTLDGDPVSVPGYSEMTDDLYDGVVEQADVPLLTDDYAPTDSLIDVN